MRHLMLSVSALYVATLLSGCDPDTDPVTPPAEPLADTVVLTLQRDDSQWTVGVHDTITFSGIAVANSSIDLQNNLAHFALTIGVCDTTPAYGMASFRQARLGVDAQILMRVGDLSYTDTAGYDRAFFIHQLPDGHAYPFRFQVIPLIEGTFFIRGGAGEGAYLDNRYDARTKTRHASGDLHHRLHQGNGEDTLTAGDPVYDNTYFFAAQ